MADEPSRTGTGDLPPPTPPPAFDGGRPGGGNGSPRRTYDRVPPHSLDAEVSVLGAALLSKSAAAEVIELVRPSDFYRSAHRSIYEGIQELFSRGEPIDSVTIIDWLARNNKLEEVGGAPAIHDLISQVPTAANASHYARIVHEKALLRALIDAGTEIAKLGYQDADDVDLTVDRAEALIYEVGQSGQSRDYAQLKDLLNASFERIEQLAENRSEVTGLATGFNDFDRLTAGLQDQNLVIIAARPAMGKCPTLRNTWITDSKTGARYQLSDVAADAEVRADLHVAALGEDWRLHATQPIDFIDNGTAPVFRLRTRLGRVIDATANHPFRVFDRWQPLEALSPGDVIASPRLLDVFGRDSLERGADEAALLGYLVGDGSLVGTTPTLTTADRRIQAEVTALAGRLATRVSVARKAGTEAVELNFAGISHRATQVDVIERAGSDVSKDDVRRVRSEQGTVGVWKRVRVLEAIEYHQYTGVRPPNQLRRCLEGHRLWGCGSHDKFVPQAIFRAPRDQVATFLSRLYACDGSARVADKHGYFGISYTTVSERLARDVQHLLLRFGILAKLRERQVKYDGVRRRAFELEIRDAVNGRRFIEEIGIFSKEAQCRAVLEAIEARGVAHTNTDLLPIEVWNLILAEKGERSWAEVSAATGRPRNHNWHVGKRRPSRRLVAELAEALDSQRLRDLAASDVYWDEVVSIEPHGVEPVYDLEVPYFHNFVANDLIIHNSSLSTGIAHYVTAELNKPVIIFSLEMSKIEIVLRLLSAEARIDSAKLRTGRLDDGDWRKLGDALGKLSNAPLFIDDTPSITMMEIRSKSRRLKQQHGLGLVIVDYLQLMQSHRPVDSRQQEVAEFSRGLKMLAKELDVPVMALSQLSRNPENRTDKRPQLADLRESGCLTRATRLFRSDTGEPVTFGQLLDGGLTDVPVWTKDERGKLVPGQLTHAFPSGRKEVFRVTMRSGTVVEATANHPFFTVDGWRPLGELSAQSRVATVRRLPEPTDPVPMDRDELVLLAHLIGDGTTVARQPVHYTSADASNLEAVEKAAFRRFGITAVHRPDGRSERTTQLYLPAPYRLGHGRRNPIAQWLDGLGAWDRRSYEKSLPAPVFALPYEQVRLFLRHLWATDGSISRRRPGRKGPLLRLYYATSSPRLAQDVRLLLLRLGIVARIVTVHHTNSPRPGYQVVISSAAQQRRFITEAGIHGERGRELDSIAKELADIASNTNVDTIPREVWDEVRTVRADSGMTERGFQAALETQYCGTTLYRTSIGRERLSRVAAILDNERLADLSTSDLFWDEVASVENIGVQDVYDATVAGTHNFVAEGVVLHNSLEQDSDIVGFIYRDEVYNADSPDRGMAELIIAKHRNGPTGTVKLAFLSHLTRFANLAHGASSAPAPTAEAPPPPSPV